MLISSIFPPLTPINLRFSPQHLQIQSLDLFSLMCTCVTEKLHTLPKTQFKLSALPDLSELDYCHTSRASVNEPLKSLYLALRSSVKPTLCSIPASGTWPCLFSPHHRNLCNLSLQLQTSKLSDFTVLLLDPGESLLQQSTRASIHSHIELTRIRCGHMWRGWIHPLSQGSSQSRRENTNLTDHALEEASHLEIPGYSGAWKAGNKVIYLGSVEHQEWKRPLRRTPGLSVPKLLLTAHKGRKKGAGWDKRETGRWNLSIIMLSFAQTQAKNG